MPPNQTLSTEAGELQAAVSSALDEFDRLGRDGFLAKYGFGRARRYFVRREGKYYDSKAVAGAAVGFEHPERGPLSHNEFAGGEHGAKARLVELGFEVVARPGLAAADVLTLRDALQVSLDAQRNRREGEWSDDLQKAIAVTLPNAIRGVVGHAFRVKGSAGAGNQAEIPWVSVMPPGVKGASEGRYVVYLFSADGESVYLSLSQAVTGQAKGELGELAQQLRDETGGQPDLLEQIDLGAHGDLGQRYARATSYALRYNVDGLPEQEALERDLDRFLELLDRAQPRDAVTENVWVFQANPVYYDIDRALRELAEIEWTVRQYRRRVRLGDRVYVWRSGQDGGVVAVGSIGSDVYESRPDDAEDVYYRRREDFSKVEPRVRIRIDQLVDPPLQRGTLKSDAVLSNLGILRFANATVHEVTAEQDARLRELIHGGSGPRVPKEQFTVEAIKRAATREPRRLSLDEEIYASVFAALESGKHVVLTGPPGTAKTTLAEAVAEAAAKAGLCDGHVLTTATADWTTYETIGGLKPDSSGELVFAPGHFLEAIERNQWLVIDELNRSNFDRAFGQLFTVLSGQAVQLPYTRRGKPSPLALVPEGASAPPGSDPLRIPNGWRVVATMNVFDKSLLFEMSFALMRRFAFIEVPSPGEDVFDDLIADAADTDTGAIELTKQFLKLRAHKDLGPALFMDMARYLAVRGTTDGAEPGQLAFEAFYSFLLPQFEGIDQATGERVFATVKPLVGKKRSERLRATLNTVLGLEIGAPTLANDEEDEDLVVPDEPDLGEE